MTTKYVIFMKDETADNRFIVGSASTFDKAQALEITILADIIKTLSKGNINDERLRWLNVRSHRGGFIEYDGFTLEIEYAEG